MIFNCFEHIFQHIARSRNQQYLVRASYLEIYQVGSGRTSPFKTVPLDPFFLVGFDYLLIIWAGSSEENIVRQSFEELVFAPRMHQIVHVYRGGDVRNEIFHEYYMPIISECLNMLL